MRLLYVIDYYHPHIGGVEKLFKTLAESQIKIGNQVRVITWKYDNKLKTREEINGVEVIRIPSFSRALFSIFALPIIISNSKRSDLIHTSTYSSAFGTYIASKITKTKIIITVHEVWGKLWLKLPYISNLEKYIFMVLEKDILKMKYDKYIAVSSSTKKEMLKLGIKAEKVEVIYNGIEYNMPKWKGERIPYTFTFFGRGGLSKGIDILLGAAEKITKEYPELRFKFIISPQIKSIYKMIIKRINSYPLKHSSVIYRNLPYIQLIDELINSSCVIIPSYSEGFCFTAVETSAMNIPIISSGKGSLPEVVSGKVITMENMDVESLEEAMIKAIDNNFEDIPLKIFPIEEFVTGHQTVYENLVKKTTN